eukprot:scaffold65144_cov39-Phaeocystis_antarctica.AAC.1
MKGTSAHVALELSHVEPIDQRSGKRKADGVWHFWERAGQRHDALNALRATARVSFLIHGPHATHPLCISTVGSSPPLQHLECSGVVGGGEHHGAPRACQPLLQAGLSAVERG